MNTTEEYCHLRFKFIITDCELNNGRIIGIATCASFPDRGEYKPEEFTDSKPFHDNEDRVDFIKNFITSTTNHFMQYGNFEGLK